MRRLCLIAWLLPVNANAQSPAEPAPPPESTAPATESEAAVAPVAEPAPRAEPGSEPAPSPPEEPLDYDPRPPAVQPPAQATKFHEGLTVEANLGVGWARTSPAMSPSFTSDLGFGGASLGVGHWVTPKLAVSGRIAGVTIVDQGARASALFIGPSAQYWVDDHFWAGGGLGLGLYMTSDDSNNGDVLAGLGLDLRVGYTFTTNNVNTWNTSLEINPGRFSDTPESAWITGVGILVGYQHL
jgi:hypothetical protein